MVSAVSTKTTSPSTLPLASGGKSQEATLQAELATKQNELLEARTDSEKTKINSEIATLKASISALKTTGQQDAAALQDAKTDSSAAKASVKVTAADKASPESKVSSGGMDVMMRFGQQGGMMPPGGSNNAGGPPSISQIYTGMDTDSDGKVTKNEFVTGAKDHLSADQAGRIFASIDTENKGSITEDQFASSLKQHGGPQFADGPGRPPMGPWSGGAPQPFAGQTATSGQAAAKIA